MDNDTRIYQTLVQARDALASLLEAYADLAAEQGPDGHVTYSTRLPYAELIQRLDEDITWLMVNGAAEDLD